MTRNRRELKKADLLAALSELVDVDPEEYANDKARCHFCLRDEGRLHDEDCAWLVAAIICRGEASIARRRVGEDEDDFEDRLEDDEDLDEPFDRKALAAEARAQLADALGARPPSVENVPPDLVDEILDDPLDAPTAFEPDEE